jgi:hypothetical protein
MCRIIFLVVRCKFSMHRDVCSIQIGMRKCKQSGQSTGDFKSAALLYILTHNSISDSTKQIYAQRTTTK